MISWIGATIAVAGALTALWITMGTYAVLAETARTLARTERRTAATWERLGHYDEAREARDRAAERDREARKFARLAWVRASGSR